MRRPPHTPLPPGSTIGILGGGQLGRMLALAAARLGYRCHVFCPDEDSPASQVAARATVAAYDDEAALGAFAAAVDVATYEFENIPAKAARCVAHAVPLLPDPEVLAICQDRLREKDFLRGIGIPTTRYGECYNVDELRDVLERIGRPAVVKSARFGYDGKGQTLIRRDTDADEAWADIVASSGEAAAIVEAWVDFTLEISVVVARSGAGHIAAYVPVENLHENHVLKRTVAPARVDAAIAREASALAHRIARDIGLVGVMAVEMFVTADERVLVNELAPRPHNSGHWTIDACAISQFEQSVRAICGLPLGGPDRHSDAIMDNLLGKEVDRWRELIADPRACLHLYGKREARPGRKMGHVTRLYRKS